MKVSKHRDDREEGILANLQGFEETPESVEGRKPPAVFVLRKLALADPGKASERSLRELAKLTKKEESEAEPSRTASTAQPTTPSFGISPPREELQNKRDEPRRKPTRLRSDLGDLDPLRSSGRGDRSRRRPSSAQERLVLGIPLSAYGKDEGLSIIEGGKREI